MNAESFGDIGWQLAGDVLFNSRLDRIADNATVSELVVAMGRAEQEIAADSNSHKDRHGDRSDLPNLLSSPTCADLRDHPGQLALRTWIPTRRFVLAK